MNRRYCWQRERAHIREIGQKRIRRGSFTSIAELIAANEDHLQTHNQAPKRFVWTTDADMILAKINRRKEASVTAHEIELSQHDHGQHA